MLGYKGLSSKPSIEINTIYEALINKEKWEEVFSSNKKREAMVNTVKCDSGIIISRQSRTGFGLHVLDSGMSHEI